MWLLIPILAALLAVVLLAGAVVAVVATVGVMLAAFVRAVPMLVVLLAVWLIARAIHGGHDDWRWRQNARSRPRANHRPRSGVSGLPQRVPVRPVPAQPLPTRRPEPKPARELPIDVQVKVDQIRRKADLLITYADRFPPFSQDLHIVRQTTAEYLPRTVEAYLAVPGVGDPLFSASSVRALEELKGQLTLLDSKLDEIARDLQRHDLDQLLANRRFLEERFGLRERQSRVDPSRENAGAA